MSEREDWLRNLKQGDEVGREMRSGIGRFRHVEFFVVKRRTSNFVFIGSQHNDYEQKFRASDGREPGHGVYLLRQPTPELKAELEQQTRKQQALKQIDSVKWTEMDLELLESVVALLSQKETPNA